MLQLVESSLILKRECSLILRLQSTSIRPNNNFKWQH